MSEISPLQTVSARANSLGQTSNGPVSKGQGGAQGASEAASRLSGGPGNTDFASVVNEVRSFDTVVTKESTRLQDLSRTAIKDFLADWQMLESRSMRAIKRLSPESRELVELQLFTGQFNLKTEMLSRVGEALNSSLRRVQQMNG